MVLRNYKIMLIYLSDDFLDYGIFIVLLDNFYPLYAQWNQCCLFYKYIQTTFSILLIME